MTRPADDDERVPVAEAGLERGKVDPLGEQPSLFAEVAHRVVGKGLERLRDATPLLREARGEVVRALDLARGQARAVAEEIRAPDGEHLPVVHVVEQLRAGGIDQADAAAHEQQGTGVGEATALRVRDVHHHAHARLEQLLGRDTVEIGVVDDRDVARREASSEALGAPVEPGGPAVLDVAHRTVERNSLPPSIRSSSSRRSSPESSWIRVTVGSPGTFSTRK